MELITSKVYIGLVTIAVFVFLYYLLTTYVKSCVHNELGKLRKKQKNVKKTAEEQKIAQIEQNHNTQQEQEFITVNADNQDHSQDIESYMDPMENQQSTFDNQNGAGYNNQNETMGNNILMRDMIDGTR